MDSSSLIIVSIILLIVLQIVLPAFLIWQLGWSRHRSKMNLILKLLLAWTYCVYIYLAGQWSFVPYSLRYIMLTALLLASIYPLLSFRSLPFKHEMNVFKWIGNIALLGLITLFAMAVFEVVRGKTVNETALDLHYPLKSGFIGHGGNSTIINYHHADTTAQHYAMDISNINKLGVRALGLFPDDLDKYVVYGDTVYAPCSGRVIEVKDGLENLPPGTKDKENIRGNYIIIQYDGYLIFMCHFLKNSILVKEGDQIKVKQPVAQVGNSGHTSEPHLHMHAIKGIDPDSILTGQGVPILFEGKFLCRNDRFKWHH